METRLINTNEMKNRAYEFVDIHKDSSDEKQMAQMWVRDFYRVFGVPYQKVRIGFEWRVNIDGKTKFVDHLINGLLLIEMKSRGKSLDKAQSQAYRYVMNLNKEDLPKYILISDFERIRLYDLKIDDEKNYYDFRVEDLPKNLELFNFLIGKQISVSIPQNPVNIKAAKLMESLHIKLLEAKYPPNLTNLLMTRLVFCLFAEDSDIFKKNQFSNFIKNYTREDGSDLVTQISTLFEVLNTPYENRYQTGDLNDFPYINGGLFKIPQATGLMLTTEIRNLLLETSSLDWSKISPVIFGSMFEGAMDKEKRHNLGAHYTSEKNIMKVVNGLFLEELIEKFEEIKSLRRGRVKALEEFHKELSELKFLDPACGSGNFLLVAYRELRRLEHQVIDELQRGQTVMDISELIKVEVNQFYGIEIEAYAVSIAKLSLWIMDHLMNLEASELFGQHYVRLPLHASANIMHDNALTVDWNEVIDSKDLNYILGNPPFIGNSMMSKEQKLDFNNTTRVLKKKGHMDFVSAWFLKASEYMQETSIKCALVSTNSIVQGEHAIYLWQHLIEELGVEINFGHQTFNWDNNGAKVHVVIVGFSMKNQVKSKRLFIYKDINGSPEETFVGEINQYLLPAPTVIITPSKKQISGFPLMIIGTMPRDGGNLVLNSQEKDELLKKYPQLKERIRPYIGGKELIHNIERYILYLKGLSVNELRKMKDVYERVQALIKTRENSKSPDIQKWSKRPLEFMQDNALENDFLLIPRVSSGNRDYLPIAFESYPTLGSEKTFQLENADLYIFGILNSKMHNAWTKVVAGRLKNDINYSNTITYNNFVFPNANSTDKEKISELSTKILQIRKSLNLSLGELYDPEFMPHNLRKAHNHLDSYIEKLYRNKPFINDEDRVATLISLYTQTKRGG